MAVKDLTSTEVSNLSQTRDPRGGFLYAERGRQPYYDWMVQTLSHLGFALAGWLLVRPDDSSATTVRILPGRATIDGAVRAYAGGTLSLAAQDDDTAYVYASDSGAAITITAVADATGWPLTPHIKLAEVTLVSGAITAIVDRRPEAPLTADTSYTLSIETQGTTSGASRIHIDGAGGVDYLRVRVCDSAAYANATNATIAAAGSSSLVETLTANKDLVFKSDANGRFEFDLTDATAETVTLRIGPATLSARRADYRATLDVTHAA